MDALGYEAPGQLAEFSPFARSPQGDAGAGGFAPTACKRLRRQTTPSRPLACAYPRKRGTETLPPVAPLVASPRPDRARACAPNPCPASARLPTSWTPRSIHGPAFEITICDVKSAPVWRSIVLRGNVPDGILLRGVRRRQELLHRAEEDGDLPVVFLDLAGQIPVRAQDFAQ